MSGVVSRSWYGLDERTDRRGWRLTPAGLQIVRELTPEEWFECGRYLRSVGNGVAWAVGDWLVYGGGRGDYGETYTRAAAITGRSFDSLEQYVRVSKAFRLEQRVPGASWTHHREALRVQADDRRAMLERAVNGRWTMAQFRGAIEAYQNQAIDTYSATPTAIAQPGQVRRWTRTRLTLQKNPKRTVCCPKCHHRWQITERLEREEPAS